MRAPYFTWTETLSVTFFHRKLWSLSFGTTRSGKSACALPSDVVGAPPSIQQRMSLSWVAETLWSVFGIAAPYFAISGLFICGMVTFFQRKLCSLSLGFTRTGKSAFAVSRNVGALTSAA